MVVYVKALCVGVLCGHGGAGSVVPWYLKKTEVVLSCTKNELEHPFHGVPMINWITSVIDYKGMKEDIMMLTDYESFKGPMVCQCRIFPFVLLMMSLFSHRRQHRKDAFSCELLLFTLNPPVHPSLISPPGVCNTHARLSRYTPLCLSSQSDCLLPIIKPFIKLMGTSPILNNFSSL